MAMTPKVQKKSDYDMSSVIAQKTTPLFGLWKDYNPSKGPADDENRLNFNPTGDLFFPGQNGTNIIAHIGTTVVMDCLITKPDLGEIAPVSFFY